MNAPEDALVALQYDHREDALTCYDHPEAYCCVCGAHDVGSHRAHLAQVLAEYVAEREAQAWDAGWCAGASNVFATAGQQPMPQGNPYRPGGRCDHGYPPVNPDGTCPSCGLTRADRKDQEADRG